MPVKLTALTGKGKLIYTEQKLIYVGIFMNGLREIKGNLSSMDNKYLYDMYIVLSQHNLRE